MSVVQTMQLARVQEASNEDIEVLSSQSIHKLRTDKSSMKMSPYNFANEDGARGSSKRNEHFSSSDSDSIDESDSECTNPYLESLMNRYFPSDDEDLGCEADVEYYDNNFESLNGWRTKERMSKKNCKRTHLTRNKHDKSGSSSPFRKRPNPSSYKSNATQKRSLRHRRISHKMMSDLIVHENDQVYEDIEVKMPQSNNFNAVQWLEEARLQYVVGEVSRQKHFNNYSPRDSNASSINWHDEDRLQQEESGSSGKSTDVKKSLFSSVGDDKSRIIQGVMSLTDNLDSKPDRETDNEDDLELTFRARQIQHALRLQEMRELAIEAEKAAKEGKEKFVGNATRFGVDDTLSQASPNIKSPRQMERNFHQNLQKSGKIDFSCKEQDNSQQNHSPKLSTITHRLLPSPNQHVFRTDIKRPKPFSLSDRLSSAPSKLQNRSSLPSISNVPSTISSILTEKSFLTLNEKKVPVLSLRHIEEVIPSFGEMHPFVRSHMVQNGVKKNMLTLNPPRKNRGESFDKKKGNRNNGKSDSERGSATGSSVFSNSLFPRIQSFQNLLPSYSGLSGEDSIQPKSKAAHDSDVETGSEGSPKKDGCNAMIATNADCISLVSCGDSSFEGNIFQPFHSDNKFEHNNTTKDDVIVMEINNNSKKTDNISEVDDRNLEIVMSKSEQSEIYVYTLASEIHRPGKRRHSSPIQPPYYEIDDSIKDRICADFSLPPTESSPKSRWSKFWANISPSKQLLQPVPKRALSLPVRKKVGDFSNIINQQSTGPFTDFDDVIVSQHQSDAPSYRQTEFSKKLPFRRHSDSSDYNLEFTSANSQEPSMKAYDPSSWNSLKTATTQKSSCESESAFSLYSKQQVRKDSASSMVCIKEDNRKCGDRQFLYRDSESVTSPKPPLHPAGIRLTTTLLNNAGLKSGEEDQERNFPPLKNNKSMPEVCSSEIAEVQFCKNDSDDKNEDAKDEDSSTQKQNNHLNSHNSKKEKKQDAKAEIIPGFENLDIKRIGSFSSIPSCCIGEESIAGDEDQSIQGVSYRDIMTKIEKPLEILVDTSDDEKNESLNSFMELMDNVKVPSMINRFSPLLGSRKKEPSNQDHSAFIGNYFYIGVESDSEVKSKNNEVFEEYIFRRNGKVCDRGSCIDSNSCGDFGTIMIERAFNILSKKSSWDKDSGPLLNEPHSDDAGPWLQKALSQCAGRRHHQQRREVVIIGGKSFRAPNLQIQKGGFFTRNVDDEDHQTFKVGREASSNSLFQDSSSPHIEIGPIKEDNDGHSTSSIQYVGLPIQFVEDEMNNLVLKEKMEKHKSLLTFSDDDYSDNV